MQKLHDEVQSKGYIPYLQENKHDKRNFQKALKDLGSKVINGEIDSFVILPGGGCGEKNEKTFFGEGIYTFYIKKP